MLRDSKWRLGFLLGVLFLLWLFAGFPLLGKAGIIPYGGGAANIGEGFFLVMPWLLIELLMVSLLCFPSMRRISFGLSVPLLMLQLIVGVLSLHLGLLVAFVVDLPGWVPLLIVGIVYFVSASSGISRTNNRSNYPQREESISQSRRDQGEMH